ncbi:hypothetical protein AX15_003664 [Amanita polypyramis BW_CC]|nr:hypothetical protein AX15_003664 [Amanita polypyramis BW_CC]
MDIGMDHILSDTFEEAGPISRGWKSDRAGMAETGITQALISPVYSDQCKPSAFSLTTPSTTMSMEGTRLTAPPRPMGPRSFSPRSSSSLRHPTETPPLNIVRHAESFQFSPAPRPPKPSSGPGKRILPTVQIPAEKPSYYNGQVAQLDTSDATIHEMPQKPAPSNKRTILSLRIPDENPIYYNWSQAQSETPDLATLKPDAPQVTVVPKGPIGDIETLLHEISIRHDDRPVDDVADIGPLRSSIVDTNYTDEAFEQLDTLGEGAGGIVHKVKEKRSGKVMARKTIMTREAPMKQLLRELQIVSSNRHPNIIHFYGAYMSPSTSEVKILMDYCEGGSLEAVGKQIKERGAVVGEMIAARIAEGVLQGLAYLHSRKTIHRDIKPSNILLAQDGVIKLCDFGVSGELVDSLAGTFTGTSMYMAPERISGRDYTIRSDVWSMGISLLELAQNRFPFPSDLPPIELIIHITRGDPPRLEDEAGVKWSNEMKDFIQQALTHDQAGRPAPKEMLMHPWITKAMREDVHMSKWIRQVWKAKRSRDSSN